MYSLELEISGLNETVAIFERMAARLRDTRLPQRMAAEIIADATKERFMSGIEPDILPASRKKRKGSKTAPPLIDTGDLFAMAVSTREGAQAGTRKSLYHVGADGLLTMGVEAPDAQRHQYGFDGVDAAGRNVNSPARPFMDISDETAEKIAAAVGEWVDMVIE